MEENKEEKNNGKIQAIPAQDEKIESNETTSNTTFENNDVNQNNYQSQNNAIVSTWKKLKPLTKVAIIGGIILFIGLISIPFMNPIRFESPMLSYNSDSDNGENNDTTVQKDFSEFKWDDIVLKDIIPETMTSEGKIDSNSKEYLSLDVYNFSESQYNEYVDRCKEMGFTVETNQISGLFEAYNEAGYKLSLQYYINDNKMSIRVNEPMKLQEIEWPDNEYTKVIPKPESKLGKIEKNSESGIEIYIGNTSKDDFEKYIEACKNKGFTIDESALSTSYTAKNAEEYKINVEYKGNKIIKISMDERIFETEIEINCKENWVFSKYDVKVYIDTEYTSDGTIKHGTTEKYKKYFKAGSHYIKFVNNEDSSVTGKVEFNIIRKEPIKITIECTSGAINAKVTNLADIEAKLVKMVDVKGLTLDKAKEKIKAAGFANIKEETDDGSSVWVDSNWTVREQSVAPNEEVMSNTEILLKCYKPEVKKETSTTTTPTYSSNENKDPYDDTDHKYDAREAFEKAIEEECPWGVKFHWIVGLIASRYEGNGEYFFKVKVTIKNAYGTKRETTAEGRVNAAQGNKVTYTHIY